ncbi:hypothetical protein G3I37_22910, partial [Streptomyces anulatus]|nr:hypothetical protein [Streptomyces anulatus]
RATSAANLSRQLAGKAASAAAAAHKAANSAADHADKAAAAAEEAAKYAGQAIELATRSRVFAEEAMKAATTAADAVKEATDVEAAAREAEAARIEQDTEVGIIAARLKAAQEQEALKRIETQRTQSDQTAQEIRDLIARAQDAFTAGDEAKAVSSGREAAVKLLDSHGTWTRQAAEFALAAGDYEILNWIDVDRPAAQRQDDRETVLALAEMAAPDVAAGAHVALKSQDPDAASQFLEKGVTDTSVEENRVKVFTILGQQPGPAVKAKAEAALADGSPTALFNFLSTEYVEAVKEDDTVEVFKILNTGGAYLRSAAKVVLEGSALMRRSFIANDQFNVARLDHDAEAHVAAIRAAIAHAAQVAQRALEDAAR